MTSRSVTTTIHNYSVIECLSAFQKSIRRGMEREALFWAAELELSGLGKKLWNRIRIIASEDVGLACVGLPADIRALYENWEDIRTTGSEGQQKLFTVHAVLILCRAEKSRMVDNALTVSYTQKKLYDIPDFALDKHTRRGRDMGRGEEHWIAEGSHINNIGFYDIYKKEADEILLETERENKNEGKNGSKPLRAAEGIQE